jgi:hypothetical protein
MDTKFQISDIKVLSKDGYNELCGSINGSHVYFRVPEKFNLYPMVECFLGIALLDAMAANSTIIIDDSISISKDLYDRIHEIQAIYSCWNTDLHVVELKAKVSAEPITFDLVGSFFSAGVDSSHTLLRNKEDISHLIMFRAFDSGNDEESWQKRVVKQTHFAESIGKILIPVDTNVKEWTESRKISWEFVHGLFLSSVGSIFGMKRIYIPSSHTYDELFPWGSHPLSDPMWSTESTTVLHDGAGFRRGEKMRDLLKEKILADNLQVCWRSTLDNCGECSKCVRSMVATKLLGGEIKSLPHLVSIDELKVLKATDESGSTFLDDAMILARESGNKEIYKVLKRYYRRYQVGLILPLIDRYLFGNFLRSLYRRVFKPDWLNYRVTLRGSNRVDSCRPYEP